MRIRSSAASIAAFIITAGLLAGCSTPAAPEPTDSPAASTPSPEPSPTATPATAPDLAALCEQLLPLETVQGRFGQDLALVDFAVDDGEPDLSTWGALAQGSVPCLWSRASNEPYSPVVAAHLRTDIGNYENYRASVEQYLQPGDRLDHYGDSVEQCWAGYLRCESAIRLDAERWAAVVLPAGAEGFEPTSVRDELAPLLESIVERARELEVSPAPLPQVACDELLSLEQARDLAQVDDLRFVDGRAGLEGNTEVGGLWHHAYNTVPCSWALPVADGFEFAAYAVTAAPEIIAAAWEDFDVPVTGERFSSEPVEIAGADHAVRITPIDGMSSTIQFVVDGTWVLVFAPDEQRDAVIERIVANLAS